MSLSSTLLYCPCVLLSLISLFRSLILSPCHSLSLSLSLTLSFSLSLSLFQSFQNLSFSLSLTPSLPPPQGDIILNKIRYHSSALNTFQSSGLDNLYWYMYNCNRLKLERICMEIHKNKYVIITVIKFVFFGVMYIPNTS